MGLTDFQSGPTLAIIKLIIIFGCLVLGWFQFIHWLGCGYTTQPKSHVTQLKAGRPHFCVQSKEGSVSYWFNTLLQLSVTDMSLLSCVVLHTVTARHVYFVHPRCFLFCLCSIICLCGLLDPLLGSSFPFPSLIFSLYIYPESVLRLFFFH